MKHQCIGRLEWSIGRDGIHNQRRLHSVPYRYIVLNTACPVATMEDSLKANPSCMKEAVWAWDKNSLQIEIRKASSAMIQIP
jgi:hypothetical protein